MGKTFTLSNAAKADLKGIALFTQKEWGREQRNAYVKQFDDVFHKLAGTPLVGKTCDHIKLGYKKYPVGSHIIFYKNEANSSLEVVRILHKRMDVDLNF